MCSTIWSPDFREGQKKLLEIGRVLLANPKMILLDEPMAGVNPTLVQEIGFCCNDRMRPQRGLIRGQSHGKNFELLSQRRIRIEGVSRLSLAHHVNHFDTGQDDRG